ncbi:Calx-beta domain-containing protein [Actinoplanes ianthinogenes]|uniref:Calx-beta domain-containing protein n=1 Tax=Actinoplanes ianthinogenes TaxID=122358 RepID=UPI0016701C04|nr:Calx-beta domain-containing protein [Actinoplanes ianthinogenes]
MTLWGPKRIRTVLATVAAAAAGLVPAMMVPTPALAANPSSVDNLTISDAGNWEGSKVTFTVTYAGSAPGDFTFSTADIAGQATGVASFSNSGADDLQDYISTPSRTSITFPGTAASTNNTVTVTVDTQKDAGTTDETFSLVATDTLSNTKSATGTIWAASSYPTFALSPSTSTVAETATKDAGGNPVQKTVTVTATLTAPLAHDISIPVSTANGDNADPLKDAVSTGGVLRDYDALPSTAMITIPAYTYTGSTTVQLYDDNVDETDAAGQFFWVKAAATPVLLSTTPSTTDKAKITITDDDATPVATIGDAAAAVTEGGALNFPVTLDRPSDATNLVVGYYSADGTTTTDSTAATASADITTPGTSGSPNTATIPAYATTRTIAVPTVDDATFEGTENVKEILTSTSTVGVTIGTKSTGVGTIKDNDAGPAVTLTTVTTVPGDPLPEGDSGEKVQKIKVTVASSPSTNPVPVKIDWATKDGTATAGSDYKAASGSFTIPAGTTLADWYGEIPITVYGDTVKEGTENFTIDVTSSTSTIGAVSSSPSPITITESGEADAKPTFNVGDVSVAEGNSGTTLAKVPIVMTGASPTDTVFTTTFHDGSAITGGTAAGDNDYTPPTDSTVTIKAGDKTGWLSIPINADTTFERDQVFSVDVTTLSGNVTYLNTPDVQHTARVTIGNDDTQPTITFNSSNATEGQPVTVTGKVVGVSEYAYSVGLTIGGSEKDPATAGTDFKAPDALTGTRIAVPRGYSGALTDIPTVGGSYTWNVTTLDDLIDEPTEGFTVTANETTATGFTPASGTYKIADDPLDLPPAVSVGDVTVNEKDGNAEVPVNLAFTGDATSTVQSVTIPYYTADGTAKAGKDYTLTKGTLTVAPGTMTGTIKVPIINDAEMEPDETFSVRLGAVGPVGASVLSGDSTVTIKSDDMSNPVTPTLAASGPAKGAGVFTLSGKAAPNTKVELWGSALPATDPTKMDYYQIVTSDGSGNFSFKTKSLTQGYAFVARSQEINSKTVTVKLTQNPALTLGSTKGKLTVTVNGNPKAAGQTVTVQRLVSGKWTTIASGKTTASGFSKSVSIKSKTKVSVRAMVSGNSSMGIASGYSATKTITIK